jgi:hypothetical protein
MDGNEWDDFFQKKMNPSISLLHLAEMNEMGSFHNHCLIRYPMPAPKQH